MEKTDDKLLFEISDKMHMNSNLFFMIAGIIGLYACTIDTSSHPKANFNEVILFSLSFVGLVKGGYSFFYFLKNNNRIQFFANRLTKTHSNVTLNTKDIKEVYIVSYFFLLFLDNIIRLNRLNFFAKLLTLLLSVVIFVIYIPVYLFNYFYYKEKIKQPVVTLIGENGKDYFFIPLSSLNEEEKEKVRLYILNNTNVDIEQLKLLWFIPKKD